MKKIFVLLLLLIIISCKKNDNPVDTVEPVNLYAGIWDITLLEGLDGYFTGLIKSDSEFNWTLPVYNLVTQSYTYYDVKGSVSEYGILVATVYLKQNNKGYFKGNINDKNGWGEYVVNSKKGKWTAQKR